MPEGRGRILVVEDDPKISDVLDYALKAEGYDVEISNRGRAAISLCHDSPPDVLVMDVGLPDIDGFEVCRAKVSRGAKFHLVMHTDFSEINFSGGTGSPTNRG